MVPVRHVSISRVCAGALHLRPGLRPQSRPVRSNAGRVCVLGVTVLPDPDQRASEQPTGRGDRPSTVRITDFGDEVHLWVEQRVPWRVALKIMKLLKGPDPPEDGEGEP